MSINENSQDQEFSLISEAISCVNQDRLLELSNSVYMNVRKAVARNRHLNATTVNSMAQKDRASSVLYWLFKNPACHIKRELSDEDLNHKCVTCVISEVKLCNECKNCTR